MVGGGGEGWLDRTRPLGLSSAAFSYNEVTGFLAPFVGPTNRVTRGPSN